MRKILTLILLLLTTATGAMADNVCSVSVSGKTATMSNGVVSIQIDSKGHVTSYKFMGQQVVASSNNGIYLDYNTTAAANPSFDEVKIIKDTEDYCEVLFVDNSSALRFSEGFIMRKGINGLYIYVIISGTDASAGVGLREARVVSRLNTAFSYCYVNDKQQAAMPTVKEMAAADSNPIQDATYQINDTTIYTKYDWANYIDKDSLHGLFRPMADKGLGFWNIPCAKEWINGGPLRQELMVHTTNKTPLTLQMIQGEHFGASPRYFKNGEQKIYGPFLTYINYGSLDDCISDAKAMAHRQMQEWPFQWFGNDLYPVERATVTGRLNVTTGQACDSVMIVLGEKADEIRLMGNAYAFWALTDSEGRFEVKNVRPGTYSLYGYATKGDVTDELRLDDITVEKDDVDLGTIDWTPTMYEYKLFQIGESNRLSDGYRLSDTCRAYGLWDYVPSSLTFTVGSSDPAKDWYYAQIGSGTWNIKFDCDRTYTGKAYLTVSAAAMTSTPKLTVKLNNSTVGTQWATGVNDAAIYRSAVLSGIHGLHVFSFDASKLKQGTNTISLVQSAGSHGGIMYDCIKLEAGALVTSGISEMTAGTEFTDGRYYNLTGVCMGDDSDRLPAGVYIRDGKKIIVR